MVSYVHIRLHWTNTPSQLLPTLAQHRDAALYLDTVWPYTVSVYNHHQQYKRILTALPVKVRRCGHPKTVSGWYGGWNTKFSHQFFCSNSSISSGIFWSCASSIGQSLCLFSCHCQHLKFIVCIVPSQISKRTTCDLTTKMMMTSLKMTRRTTRMYYNRYTHEHLVLPGTIILLMMHNTLYIQALLF